MPKPDSPKHHSSLTSSINGAWRMHIMQRISLPALIDFYVEAGLTLPQTLRLISWQMESGYVTSETLDRLADADVS